MLIPRLCRGGRGVDVRIDALGSDTVLVEDLRDSFALIPALGEDDRPAIPIAVGDVMACNRAIALVILRQRFDDMLGDISVRLDPALIFAFIEVGRNLRRNLIENRPCENPVGQEICGRRLVDDPLREQLLEPTLLPGIGIDRSRGKTNEEHRVAFTTQSRKQLAIAGGRGVVGFVEHDAEPFLRGFQEARKMWMPFPISMGHRLQGRHDDIVGRLDLGNPIMAGGT